ncbi:hypothetical protein EVAR_44560_1 [Eumeta japonica]|uniref:Uncharacterized protein n=1 Tax=Eumeta variegata TaxID=151549 RepID=A0A4C1XBT3_EUMVA|nr:hypothetical protein EVAR_44560_1 [Eumeta japonica]
MFATAVQTFRKRRTLKKIELDINQMRACSVSLWFNVGSMRYRACFAGPSPGAGARRRAVCVNAYQLKVSPHVGRLHRPPPASINIGVGFSCFGKRCALKNAHLTLASNSIEEHRTFVLIISLPLKRYALGILTPVLSKTNAV